jgi:hypothetical protein
LFLRNEGDGNCRLPVCGHGGPRCGWGTAGTDARATGWNYGHGGPRYGWADAIVHTDPRARRPALPIWQISVMDADPVADQECGAIVEDQAI